jgi:hypothetical protein
VFTIFIPFAVSYWMDHPEIHNPTQLYTRDCRMRPCEWWASTAARACTAPCCSPSCFRTVLYWLSTLTSLQPLLSWQPLRKADIWVWPFCRTLSQDAMYESHEIWHAALIVRGSSASTALQDTQMRTAQVTRCHRWCHFDSG